MQTQVGVNYMGLSAASAKTSSNVFALVTPLNDLFRFSLTDFSYVGERILFQASIFRSTYDEP